MIEQTSTILAFFLTYCVAFPQQVETIQIERTVSKSRTIHYTRNIRKNEESQLYHVRDYYENGQLQMEAYYSNLANKYTKEEYQCNYRGNTKDGEYREWYPNGKLRYEGSFRNGLKHGLCSEFNINGSKETESNWLNGRLNGIARIYDLEGSMIRKLEFEHGVNISPRLSEYQRIVHTPKEYESDAKTEWPLIIYLHGGSDRGSDLKKLYSSGIPDQIHRGRDLPFIVAAPQCPRLLRWSTDDWFESFFDTLVEEYRIDRDRVYLTGPSLGGSGTWFIAAKHPDIFAAIAPMSGFTSHSRFIDENTHALTNLPIWSFHGMDDLVVPVSETNRMLNKLESVNSKLKVTIEPGVGHWIHWLVYPKEELYEWFLSHRRSQRE